MLRLNIALLTTAAFLAVTICSSAVHGTGTDKSYASFCNNPNPNPAESLFICFHSDDGPAVAAKQDGFAAGIDADVADSRNFVVVLEGAQSWAKFSTQNHQIDLKVSDAGPKACIEYTVTPGQKSTHCRGAGPVTIPGK